MAFMLCPKCGEHIDVSDVKSGAKIYCAQCAASMIVEKSRVLIDAKDAQVAITRARVRSKKKLVPDVRCPNCDTMNRPPAGTAAFRCLECGQKIVMGKPSQAASSVAFPSLAPSGTMLDMDETKEAWGKKSPRKK